MGSDGAAIAVDPSLAMAAYFVPQGISADIIATEFGFSRDDVDAYAVESQRRAARAWAEGRFARSIVPVTDATAVESSPATSTCARDRHAVARRAQARLQGHRRDHARLRRRGDPEVPPPRAHRPRPPRRQLLGHRRRRRGDPGRLEGVRRAARPDAARPHPRHRQGRHRPDDHADRPGPRHREGAGRRRDAHRRHRRHRGQRGVLRRGAALPAGLRRRPRPGERQRRRHRHGPPARRHRRDDPRHRPRRARAHRQGDRASPPSASPPAWGRPPSSSGSDGRHRPVEGPGEDRLDLPRALRQRRWPAAPRSASARRRASPSSA